MHQKELEFREFYKEIALLHEVSALLGWDALTGMPKAAANYRSEVESYIGGRAFELSTGKQMKEFLDYFKKNPEILSEDGKAMIQKARENYDLNQKISLEDFKAYTKCLGLADKAWHQGREAKSFAPFQASLEEIVSYLRKFIPLWRKDEKTPYDVLLNQYEPGMTVERLDPLFAELKEGLMAIRKEIQEKGIEPRTDFLNRKVSKENQKKFVMAMAHKIDYDFNKGRLDDTTHPFMEAINRSDARITTRWNEDDFKMATFGVIHEAGHGIYEQNIDPKYDYTPLSGGTSMGIHESQSLFYEMNVGSDKEFWRNNFSTFQEMTEGVFDDIDFETFYKAIHKTEASFIRIEADTLTYPIHIIIRYEIEKMLFNEDLPVSELPRVWNEKYQEYLGITPANDLEGLLQDVHWSGGSFGYFPSYALGYIYSAQLRHTMEKTIDFAEEFKKDKYTTIREWLTKHIHRFGASKKPIQLMKEATGEELNPKYLIDRQRKIYFDVYGIKE